MTLVDTNILVYATFRDAPEHRSVRNWLHGELAREDGAIVLCWPVVYAFVRLISSSRVFGPAAVSVDAGWSVAAAYMQQPDIRFVVPSAGHQAIAAELARTPGLRSDDVPDVEIAALAIEHGLSLATHDRGFRRFSGLRLTDPIAPV